MVFDRQLATGCQRVGRVIGPRGLGKLALQRLHIAPQLVAQRRPGCALAPVVGQLQGLGAVPAACVQPDQRGHGARVIGAHGHRFGIGRLRRRVVAQRGLHVTQAHGGLGGVGRLGQQGGVSGQRLRPLAGGKLGSAQCGQHVGVARGCLLQFLRHLQGRDHVVVDQMLAHQQQAHADRLGVGGAGLLQQARQLVRPAAQAGQCGDHFDVARVLGQQGLQALPGQRRLALLLVEQGQVERGGQVVRIQGQRLFKVAARSRLVALAQPGCRGQVQHHRTGRLLGLKPLHRFQRAVESTRLQVRQRQRKVGTRALRVQRGRLLQRRQTLLGVTSGQLAHPQCHQAHGGGRLAGRRLGHQRVGLGIVAGLHAGLAGQRQPLRLRRGLLQQRRQHLQCLGGLVDAQQGLHDIAAHRRVGRVGLQQLQQARLGLLRQAGLQLGLGQQAHCGHAVGCRSHRQCSRLAGQAKLPLPQVQHGLRVVDQRMPRRHLAQRVQLGLCGAELVSVDLQPCHGQARHQVARRHFDRLFQRPDRLLGLAAGLGHVGLGQPHAEQPGSGGLCAVGQQRGLGGVLVQQRQMRLAQQRTGTGRCGHQRRAE